MSDEHLRDGDIYDSMEDYGLFMLVAIRPVATEKTFRYITPGTVLRKYSGLTRGKGNCFRSEPQQKKLSVGTSW